MDANIGALKKINEKIKELNRQNNLLSSKYSNDPKYARIHKRLLERGDISKIESQIFGALAKVKIGADEENWKNTAMIDNKSYFLRSMGYFIVKAFKKEGLTINLPTLKAIINLVVTEYKKEIKRLSFK